MMVLRSPGRVGRPPVLTPEVIARAVLEVGFQNLTIAAVRQRLGVGQTTLFRHVKDRKGLIAIAWDYLIAQTDWPSLEGTWQEVLDNYAMTFWRLLETYPGAATEVASALIPRGAVYIMEDLCGVLITQGFSVENAVLACDLVFDLVTDNRRGIEQIDFPAPGQRPKRQSLHEPWINVPPKKSGNTMVTEAEREALYTAILGSTVAEPCAWFMSKLRVVLAGVEQELAP